MNENLLQGLIFWVFAGLAVLGALGAAFQKSIVYAALSMLLVFLSMAGFFILNNADFLAIAQLIIYAVGLTIIMLFAIMFTGDKFLVDNRVDKGRLVAYGIVTTFVFALLFRAVSFTFRPVVSGAADEYLTRILPAQGSTGTLGIQLFSTYGLPFELASMLLLVAMVGAIVLAKKSFTDEAHDTPKYTLETTSHPTEEARRALAQQHAIAGDPGAQAGSGENREETAGVN